MQTVVRLLTQHDYPMQQDARHNSAVLKHNSKVIGARYLRRVLEEWNECEWWRMGLGRNGRFGILIVSTMTDILLL